MYFITCNFDFVKQKPFDNFLYFLNEFTEKIGDIFGLLTPY